ncbi:hypothetical protein [Vibrio barjaei]|uniref:hypothetical protein n=1 Tax=Vibrio barjaei TaxID=1676683 RepID=UPI0022842B92|nr:hypothetical protein [Vibrio barjaei]MCY9872360.1 hypothetical protein [Vibrio barjaei]
MSELKLQSLSESLGLVLDADVKIKSVFGESLSLSVDGSAVVKSYEGDVYYHLDCHCGLPSCEIREIRQRPTVQHYDACLEGSRNYYRIDDLNEEQELELCLDVVACHRALKNHEKKYALISKGSITRKLANRLEKSGIHGIPELKEFGVGRAYYMLKDKFPSDTQITHAYAIYARLINKHTMFLTTDEKSYVEIELNKEKSRLIGLKIEQSHKSHE